jgi:hypothetical protein
MKTLKLGILIEVKVSLSLFEDDDFLEKFSIQEYEE